MFCRMCSKSNFGSITSDAEICECPSHNQQVSVKQETMLLNIDEDSEVYCVEFLDETSEEPQHPESGPERLIFRCTVCDWTYLSKTGLSDHLDLHEILDEDKELHCQETIVSHKLYECKLCSDQRLYQADLYWQHVNEDHVGLPVDNTPIKCECPICGDIFGNDELLSHHVDEVHRTIECSMCDVTFFDDEELKSHASLHHSAISSEKLTNEVSLNNQIQICSEKHTIQSKDVKTAQIETTESVTDEDTQSQLSFEENSAKNTGIKMEIAVEEPALQPLNQIQFDLTGCVRNSVLRPETSGRPRWKNQKQYRCYTIENRTFFECVTCNETFDKYNSYKWHRTKAHNSMKLFCPHCSKQLFRSIDYRHHVSKCVLKKFSCELCHRRYPTMEALKFHSKECNKIQNPAFITLPSDTVLEEPIKCECTVCGDIFGNEYLLNAHMNCAHNQTSEVDIQNPSSDLQCTTVSGRSVFECVPCQITFSSLNRYNIHKGNMHKTKYKCPNCFMQFGRKNNFLQHKKQCAVRMLEQLASQSIKCECPECGELLDNGLLLTDHVQTNHQMTVCIICVKTFLNEYELNSHKLTTHPESTLSNHPCLHCVKSYSSPEGLKRHMENCGPRVCNACHRKFPKHNYFMSHMIAYHPHLLHSCPFCPRKFVEEASCMKHAGYCAQRKYACSQCGVNRKTFSQFKQHVQLTGHSAEPVVELQKVRSQLQLPCPICKQEFRSVHTRRSHMTTAHSEPHIQCPKCDKAFHFKSRLLKHLINHEEKVSRASKPKRVKVVKEARKVRRRPVRRDQLQKNGKIRRLEKPIPCTMCKSVFYTDSNLRYHMRTMHVQPHLQCPKCDKAFHFNSRLVEHMSAHENKKKRKKMKAILEQQPLSCPICELTFISANKLRYHKSICHVVPRLKCPKCDKAFHFKSRLNDHLQRHDVNREERKKNLVISCPQCDAVFHSGHVLRLHKLTAHSEPRFQCTQCDKAFHFQCRLTKHLLFHDRMEAMKKKRREARLQKKRLKKDISSISNQFCKICNITFRSYDAKRYHMSIVHVEPRLKCNKCPRMFHFKSQLERHLQIHDRLETKVRLKLDLKTLIKRKTKPVDELKCTICSAEFTSRQTWRVHRATAHVEPRFKCSKCDKSFHFKSRLLTHLEVHERLDSKSKDVPKIRPVKLKQIHKGHSFPCSVCKVVLRSYNARRYHYSVAHKEPRLKCNKCEKPFHFRSQLARHLQMHENMDLGKMKANIKKKIKPEGHICPVCNVAFKPGNAWRVHSATAHKEPRFKCPECAKPFHFKSRYLKHIPIHGKVVFNASHITQSVDSMNQKIPSSNSTPIQNFPCKICKLVFYSYDARRYHVSVAHMEPHIKCSKCERMFHYRSQLARHLVMHSRMEKRASVRKEKKVSEKKKEVKKTKQIQGHFPCDLCSTVYRSNNTLRYHKATVHSIPQVQCPKCDKAFHYKSRLLKHLLTHKGNSVK